MLLVLPQNPLQAGDILERLAVVGFPDCFDSLIGEPLPMRAGSINQTHANFFPLVFLFIGVELACLAFRAEFLQREADRIKLTVAIAAGPHGAVSGDLLAHSPGPFLLWDFLLRRQRRRGRNLNAHDLPNDPGAAKNGIRFAVLGSNIQHAGLRHQSAASASRR